ncbi:MAG: APC family permease [Ruminococcaceae bacterium]|nr:APC family permease [Oscillospiraceae bacterium]
MKKRILSFFLGKPLKDSDLVNERLSVFWGVPVFSSDTISTVAYAGEEILIVLMPVLGMGSYKVFLGIVAVITAFLAVLTMGYRQSIEAYPQGGGAYAVAMDNLGERAGLIAGSSLVIGYVLIVAVSVSAAAAAIVSGYPALAEYKVGIALLLIALLSWVHLRGTRSAAFVIGIPTYLFVLSMLIMIVTGLVRWFTGNYTALSATVTAPDGEAALVWLTLRAFASGCTALGGIEAVSNGVANFKEPAYRTARNVLLAMALIVGTLFVGVSVLMSLYRIVPGNLSTTFSTLAAAVFGRKSPMFHVVQVTTVGILMLAANTAFADLPHLMAMMAEDGYLPKRMIYRGSRLNYSNGIAFLFSVSTALVLGFEADQHKLLPLFASGVFISFFLNQLGMLFHWKRRKGEPGHLRHSIINGVTLTATTVTLIVLILTRFLSGAWVTLLGIALLAVLMRGIQGHYRKVKRELSVTSVEEARKLLNMTHSGKVLLPVRSVNRSFIKTYNCAKDIGFTEIELLYVGSSETAAHELERQLREIGVDDPFSYEITEYRNTEDILIRRIEQEEKKLAHHQHLTVLIPTLVTSNPIKQYLHNETSRVMLRRMSRYRYVYIFQVPYLFD